MKILLNDINKSSKKECDVIDDLWDNPYEIYNFLYQNKLIDGDRFSIIIRTGIDKIRIFTNSKDSPLIYELDKIS